MESSALERATGFCPEMAADAVVLEVELYFREKFPRALELRLSDRLAARAKHLFEANPRYRRRVCGVRGRAYLLLFYRHWMAGLLAASRPALARRLPEGFRLGQPLLDY